MTNLSKCRLLSSTLIAHHKCLHANENCNRFITQRKYAFIRNNLMCNRKYKLQSHKTIEVVEPSWIFSIHGPVIQSS